MAELQNEDADYSVVQILVRRSNDSIVLCFSRPSDERLIFEKQDEFRLFYSLFEFILRKRANVSLPSFFISIPEFSALAGLIESPSKAYRSVHR